MKKKLPKILTSGSCVVDLLFKGKAFEEREKKDRFSLAFGGKYLADEFLQCYGGGGANTSVSLATQGFDVMLWTNVGNDIFGRQIVLNLRKQKVRIKLIRFKAKQTQVSSILLSSGGERTIINYRSDADLLKINNAVRREMKKRNWFFLSSLARCPKKDKIDFLKLAKKQEMKIFLSLHGTEYLKGYDYLKEYLFYSDILHLNAHEIADIFGGNAKDFNFYKTNFALKLKIPLLIVTYDVNGSFAYTKDKIYYQPIIKQKKRLDTTGAGDAFSSGFLGEYIKTDSIKKSLLFGAKNATSLIGQYGAQNGLLSK